MRNQIRPVVAGVLAVACAIASTTSLAQAARFNLPSQSLADSLRAVAGKTNSNILFNSKEVEGISARALSAEMTQAEALEELLKGTGLSYKYLDEKTVAVGSPAKMGWNADSGSHETLRLAQSDRRLSSDASGAEAEGSGRLEEVVVTAQKRIEKARDVPISIVALTADDLEKRNIISLDDLPKAVPGLAIQTNGAFVRRIMLRGISNISGSSSLIGMYLDEVPITAGADTQLDVRTYDLERVEVLRGPQGTLYGDGSVGGTIRFITKNPELDHVAANAGMKALFTQDGSPGQYVEGMLNVPVIEDKLGLRVAATYNHDGGWIDQPAAGKRDFNGGNLIDVRIKGLWQPLPQLSVSAMALIHRNNGSSNVGEDSDGNFTQVFNLTTRSEVDDDYNLYNLTLAYDFSRMRVLNTASYGKQSVDIRNGGYFFKLFTPPGVPELAQYVPLEERRSHFFSDELRLTSIGSGPWQWTLGGYYRHGRATDFSPLNYFAQGGPPGTPLPAPYVYGTGAGANTWAAFGDANYQLSDRMTVGAGLRYFHDHLENLSLTTDYFQEGTFHATNPRAYARFKLTEQVNVYASASKGFRSGGLNGLQQPPFGPETVWTYELGSKMSLVDGRLSLDTAIYYSDYTNYQIFGQLPPPSPPTSITSNAGKARVKGVEWGLAWRPLEQWEFGFNGNYATSRFYEINVLNSAHEVGDPLDLFPKYQFTVSAQRDFELAGRKGFGRLDYAQRGREEFRNRSFGIPDYEDETGTLNQLSWNMGLQWNQSLSFELFAQNLLNDRGFTDPLSLSSSAARSRPRTYGIEFRSNFN